jgi:aminoglycoside phosphotransferase family enzyme
VVDWVVWMKRLPAQRMLDRMIREHTLSRHDVETLSDVLHAFYRGAGVSALREQDYLQRFAREDRINREVLLLPRFALRGAAEVLAGYTSAMAAAQPGLRDRVRHYRLVDGHGDLRPEHVCLLPTPVVIDALEFSAELRQVDPLDELIFLSMECDLLGAAWIESVLLQRWARINGDAVPSGLLDFYRASRALLRARQCAAHLLDEHPRTPDRWLPRAQAYLDAAGQALRGVLSTPAGATPARVAAPDRPGP